MQVLGFNEITTMSKMADRLVKKNRGIFRLFCRNEPKSGGCDETFNQKSLRDQNGAGFGPAL